METTTSSNTANEAGNESDIVINHRLPSGKSKAWTRTALVMLVALLAIIAVSIAVSTDRKIISDPPATRSEVQEAAPVEEGGPKAAEAPKPAPKPPKREDNLSTMKPTIGMTVTVSTEVSAPPTTSDRSDRRNMIQSPTWRG